MDLSITLLKSQLLDDVKGKVYFTARGSETTDAEALKQEVNSNDRLDLILRSFNSAVALALAAVNPYASKATASPTDAIMSNTANVVFTLVVPDNYNTNYTYEAAQHLHDLLVDKALLDWFLQVSPDKVEGYKARIDNDINGIIIALSRRSRTIRAEVEEDDYIYEITYE